MPRKPRDITGGSPPSIEPTAGIQLLGRQIAKGRELLSAGPIQAADHNAWENTTRQYLERAFGDGSANVSAVIHAHSDVPLRMGMSAAEFERYRKSQLENQLKLLESCVEQLEAMREFDSPSPPPPVPTVAVSNKVFLVHGHDDGAKQSVARFLTLLGLDPVILHEQPSEGRTIIEKLEHYSDVRFAIALMTGDDVGAPQNAPEKVAPRARQNVVLELGFFIGRLGRSRVCALHKGGIELPSDVVGVVYVAMDERGAWRLEVARELQSAGLKVDAAALL